MDNSKTDRLLRRLPRNMHPQRDLWPEIASRIEDEGRHTRTTSWLRSVHLARYAVAAALVVAVGVLVFLISRPGGDLLSFFGRRDYVSSLGISNAEDPGMADLLDRLGAAERDYRRARQELVTSLQEVASILGDDAAVREIDNRFSAIDEVVDDLVAAVRTDPSQVDRIHRLAVFYGTQARSLTQTSLFVKDLSK